MQISECIDQGAHLLKISKVPNPRVESKRILCIALGLSTEESLLHQNRQLSDLDKNLFQNLLLRRAQREPLAYIAQNKEFYGLEFFVNKNVLIPRPDTEIIVEKILANHKNFDALEILELGVGSGCILISLLKHMPYAKALGVDLSPDALEVAQKNAINLDVANRITFRQSNWYQNVTGNFDLIISNPPYVNRKSTLSQEISFEPELALFAEKDGLDSYYEIAAGVKNFLNKDGSCYVEIGIQSKTKVIEIFEKHSVKAAQVYKDLSQIERCIRFVP
jgi:release factor glutamine methyltransferase